MKKFGKFMLASLLSSLFILPALSGCGLSGGQNDDDLPPWVDYVSMLKLDMTSNTKKQEVEVKLFIDGDTTHFNPVKNSTLTGYNEEDFAATNGVIKARYLAVNTPESTGDVEKWGKTASNFTHEKLDGATIIVESDDNNWNMDSNDRYTLWIWYVPAGEEVKAENFRNLNVELLQNGYGLAQNTATNRYGTNYAMPALTQAKEYKLKLYSDEKDDNFYEGEAYNVTLKKLRCHIDDYVNLKVRVEGIVTTQVDNSVYIEDYDEESGLYFGISIFYGFTPSPYLLKALTIGNRVSVHGTVTYSEGFGYQINGVDNNAFHPEYTTNTVAVTDKDGKVVTGEGGFPELQAKDIVSGKTEIVFEDDEKVDLNYGEAVLDTTATLKNLKVVDLYTTHNGGDNDGAISITCNQLDENGQVIPGSKITVRTTVLYHKDGSLVTQAEFPVGTMLTAKGFIEQFDGEYQLKVHVLDYLTVQS